MFVDYYTNAINEHYAKENEETKKLTSTKAHMGYELGSIVHERQTGTKQLHVLSSLSVTYQCRKVVVSATGEWTDYKR